MPDAADHIDLYEADEHAWIAEQVAALRSGQLHRLDLAHLAEFLEDMARRDRRELKSRLTILLLHLLKARMQPERLTKSWVMTILEQQREIQEFVEGIPSLGREADALLADVFPQAARLATRETGLSAARFPATSPWTLAEALAFDPPEPANRRTGRDHPYARGKASARSS